MPDTIISSGFNSRTEGNQIQFFANKFERMKYEYRRGLRALPGDMSSAAIAKFGAKNLDIETSEEAIQFAHFGGADAVEAAQRAYCVYCELFCVRNSPVPPVLTFIADQLDAEGFDIDRAALE